jgi:chromosome segregation ATPase
MLEEAGVATLEERVAYIEGQMAEQSHAFLAMRELLREIGHRIDRVDQRLDRVDQRIDRVDQRIDRIEHRLDLLDEKMSRQFLWVGGIQITTLVAVVGAVLSRG